MCLMHPKEARNDVNIVLHFKESPYMSKVTVREVASRISGLEGEGNG